MEIFERCDYFLNPVLADILIVSVVLVFCPVCYMGGMNSPWTLSDTIQNHRVHSPPAVVAMCINLAGIISQIILHLP
jgi:putative effector of murein hydrolase